MNENTEELIRLLAQDALAEEQIRDLLLECQENPETKQEAIRLQNVHRLLKAHAPAEKLHQDVQAKISKLESLNRNQQIETEVMQRIRSISQASEAEKAGRRRSFSIKATLALAASILLFLGVGWWMLLRGNAEVTAIVVEARGKVVVRSAEGREIQTIKKGQEITRGMTMETGKNGELRLAFENDVADLILGKNSKLQTAKSKSEKTLRLEIGQLTATVAKQPKESPFVVTTPQAEIRVIGTKFDLRSHEKLTQLKVNEGEVSIKGSSGDALSVKEGSIAMVAPEVSITPVLINEGQNLSGGVVFFRDFETIPEGEKSRNALVRLNESEGEVSAMLSVQSKGHSPQFQPDSELELLRISASKPTAEALYVIPTDVEIRIRIKSERPGIVGICQTPTNIRFKLEHFYAGNYEVDSEWREIVFHSRDVWPYQREGKTRDFVPGVGISSFEIYGFGTGQLYLDSFTVVSTANALGVQSKANVSEQPRPSTKRK
jgi:ferric-dicitrate binding protein FerR (iron transport regulator)